MKIALSILWVTGTIFTAQSGRSKTVLIRQGTHIAKIKIIKHIPKFLIYGANMVGESVKT